MYELTGGNTSQLIDIFIQDSSKTDGSGLAALVFNSAGLTCYYKRAGQATWTAVTLATMTQGTWATGGFKEGDATHAPGIYEFGIPDAAIAASVKWVDFYFMGATNMAPVPLRIMLKAMDFQDSVRAGLTALPNAAAGATGGMPLPVVRGGTAQAGTVNSITLDAGASATNNIYNGLLVHIISSTGAGQTRTITGYNGTSKIATVDRVFQTAPGNTSVFELLAADSPALNASLQVTSNVARVTIRSGTAQAGSTSTTIKLDSGASATSNLYNADLVTITGGTGAGQTRTIVSYVGSTKVATVDKAWVTTPDATSTFDLYASTTPSVFSDQGVAQAGGATSITLASTASGTNSVYIGSIVTILAGTGAGETKEITAYNGTTKVATVDAAWVANPDTTSVYAVIPTASGTGSTGGVQDVNVVSVGGTPQTSRDLGAVVYPIKKNTAFNGFPIEMVLASDHVSPATGKTVTATRSIDGGAYAACTNAVTEISVGTYKINLSAADLNGDSVTLKFTAAACDTTTIPLVLQG